MPSGGRIPLRFHVYWFLMRYVYPREALLYRLSSDYRRWWGPR